MPRGHPKEPGFKALPNVPYDKDDLYPNMRDADASRGALHCVPRNPIYTVQDFGAPGPREPWQASGSPASAEFTAGEPNSRVRATPKEKKALPENQIPGSLKATP